MRKRTAILACAALATAWAVAACGGDDDDFSDIEGSATARAASASPGGTEGTATTSDGQSPTAAPTQAGTTPAGTATAAATTPGGGSGGEDTADYVAAARAGHEQLKADLNTLTTDMIAAQTNQADPSLPARLSADIAAVNQSADALRGLEAPPALAAFKTDMDAALDEIQDGTASLERAITTLDQAAGVAAFASLSSGQQALDAAFATLPS